MYINSPGGVVTSGLAIYDKDRGRARARLLPDWEMAMEWGIVDKVINKRPEDPAAIKVV